MLYLVTFTINIPPTFAYISYMDPMGIYTTYIAKWGYQGDIQRTILYLGYLSLVGNTPFHPLKTSFCPQPHGHRTWEALRTASARRRAARSAAWDENVRSVHLIPSPLEQPRHRNGPPIGFCWFISLGSLYGTQQMGSWCWDKGIIPLPSQTQQNLEHVFRSLCRKTNIT